MPPPDTIIVLPNGDMKNIPDSLFDADSHIVTELPPAKKYYDYEQKPKEHWGEFFLWISFLAVLIWLKGDFAKLPQIIRTRNRRAKTKLVLDEKGSNFHNWLNDHNAYYKSLSDEGKQRFLERTVHFAGSKEFKYHSMPHEEHIPVLISGAAVQLTFGLKNYLLDYFDVIHVMRKEYVLNIDNETYYGHVSKKGIHISWIHFIEGYKDYADSVNVGLHEMAHALQFDAYLGFENEHHRNFKERLNGFSEEGRPVFRAMRAGYNLFFDDYAMTNFDEFWAVSVENFFEKPVPFKEKLPRLYKEMSELLNQDPLLPHKIIDPDLA
jgi:MtfA peptidase